MPTHHYGMRGCCSTVVLIGFTCPAITVVTVILRALVRVREGLLFLHCALWWTLGEMTALV